jgi:hypothetical protein
MDLVIAATALADRLKDFRSTTRSTRWHSGRDTPRCLPCPRPGEGDDGDMDQSPSEQPGVPAAETPQETQRSLTLTIIETAAAVKLLDEAVPDGYAIVKGGIQKAVDKIRDRGPEADPPAQDNDSAE